MQAKHCFFEQNANVRIPAGTTMLVFTRDEIFLVRSIVDYLCSQHEGDILDFQYLLEQLDQEESEQ